MSLPAAWLHITAGGYKIKVNQWKDSEGCAVCSWGWKFGMSRGRRLGGLTPNIVRYNTGMIPANFSGAPDLLAIQIVVWLISEAPSSGYQPHIPFPFPRNIHSNPPYPTLSSRNLLTTPARDKLSISTEPVRWRYIHP
jgi:hypothetical protein